ncbi:MAG: hypothetical protein VZS44_01425 [Bacilli bacterium]|nr:hypothetical protein [Bacilli bacterium]
MFIPVVPFVPHTTVINKTIVYNDIVLPLKDLGNNLKICSISNISEYSLESCLKKIFESNPDVIFNTIQYSKEGKKIYFYTDKAVSTQAWEESKITKYKPLSNSEEIIKEVDELFTQERIKDTDCISLYDIANLIKIFDNKYKYIKERYQEHFYNINPSIIIYNFDYKKKQLRIEFKNDEIFFAKQNDDLYVVESESLHYQELLTLIGKELSELYDELIKFHDFKNQSAYEIKALNSNFLVYIGQYGVDIHVDKRSNRFSKDFSLSSHSYKKEYYYECNSTSVITALKGKEDEIFKRIFVKIDDCPEWSKTILYQMRQDQLEEEKRLEEKQLYKEMKRQKRLELKRKIFPWMNK